MRNVRTCVAVLLTVLAVAGCSAGGSSPPSAPSAPAPPAPPSPPSGPAPAAAAVTPSPVARPADCPPPPPADPATRAGWLGLIAARPGTVAVVIDDGRGSIVTHGADVPMPLASATTVVHLAAYGRAVAQERIRPDDRVSLGDWERWYLPGADGDAHPGALDRLGIPRAGAAAADPTRTVAVDDLVGAMVQDSDNAAADWLRDRLGDAALLRAAADVGWRDYDLPSELGAQILLVTPEAGPPLSAPRAVRGSAEIGLARRYAVDPAYRADIGRRLAELVRGDPGRFVDASSAWADATATGTATEVAAIHRALVNGSFGAGSDVARRQLEWRPPSPRFGAVGFKGGSLPGVLTIGMATRRGSDVATAVVLARDLPPVVARFVDAQQALALEAVVDPADLRALACVA